MLERILSGGWIMLPLMLCSIVSVTIIIERFLFFRRMNVRISANQVLSLVEGRQFDEALNSMQNKEIGIMKVLRVGLNHQRHPGKAMETAGLAEISAMRRGLPALDTIITLSPLLGLLGTIVGMIGSFQIMATSGLGQPHAVTGGVGEALIATAAGITVAVITLIPYNYFLARIERETEIIEQYATRLEYALQDFMQEG